MPQLLAQKTHFRAQVHIGWEGTPKMQSPFPAPQTTYPRSVAPLARGRQPPPKPPQQPRRLSQPGTVWVPISTRLIHALFDLRQSTLGRYAFGPLIGRFDARSKNAD